MNIESPPEVYYQLDPLLWITEKDRILHRQAVERIRSLLFRRHQPADYFMIPESEGATPPSAYYDIKTGGIPAPRALRLGGLRYKVESPRPGIWYEAQVQHWQRDSFDVALIVHAGRAVYTRFVIAKPFDEIDDCLFRCVRTMRAEDTKFLS